MSEFVEECRREWRRLRVPDPVANEMAADLLADLEEAEAEGASAEDVLGSGAFDPRSFAASWAAERGVIRPPVPSEIRLRRRSRVPAALVASVVVALIGAVLAIAASPAGPERLALPAPVVRPAFVVPRGLPRLRLAPALGLRRLRLSLPRTTRVFPVQTNGSRVDLRAIGLILLILGGVGFIVSTLYWSPWAGPRRWPRRRSFGNGGSGDTGYW